MSTYIDMTNAAPNAFQAIWAMETYAKSEVDLGLLHLIKIRASILNGCCYCVDMHTTAALGAEMDSRRVASIAAWHEAPWFNDDERGVLALTDAVTKLGEGGIGDELWRTSRERFGDKGMVDLLMAISTINVWNRVMIGTRTPPPALK